MLELGGTLLTLTLTWAHNLLILRNTYFVLNFQIIRREIIYIKFIHWCAFAANLEDEMLQILFLFVIEWSEFLSVVESGFHFHSRIVIIRLIHRFTATMGRNKDDNNISTHHTESLLSAIQEIEEYPRGRRKQLVLMDPSSVIQIPNGLFQLTLLILLGNINHDGRNIWSDDSTYLMLSI